MKRFIDFDRVDQYGPQIQEAIFTFSPSQLDRVELKSPLDVKLGTETRKGEMAGEYLVEGTSEYAGELFCARCLDPFPFANRSMFTLRYMPRPTQFGGPDDELEITEDQLDLDYYNERTVPLEMIALEQLQLSLPMKALCDESCQGLCPQCGTNLQRGSCDCAEKVGDTRWESLRHFREQLTKKKEN
jgi:uncharacterized protein